MNSIKPSIGLLFSIKRCISLNYIQYNNNKDRSLVVHHGLMGSSKNFRSIVKHSNISNYVNSYLIDCRNHGLSPRTESHLIPDLAQDMYQFLKSIVIPNNKKITLMGHSMGGRALICLTITHPEIQELVDKVIIIDITPKSLSTNAATKDNWLKTGKMLQEVNKIQLKGKTTNQIYQEISKHAINQDTANLIKSDLQILGDNQHKWTTNLPTIVKNYYQMGTFDAQKYITQKNINVQWKKPIHVIFGSKSPYMSPQDIQSFKKIYPHLNDDSIYKVDGAGHWVHFDKTYEFLNIAKNILEGNN